MVESKRFTETFCGSARAVDGKRTAFWDGGCRGLLMYSYGSGRRAFYVHYRGASDGKSRFFKLGGYPGLRVKDAREAAHKVLGEVALGRDPHAERVAVRRKARDEMVRHTLGGVTDGATVAQLAEGYLADAKTELKASSWKQTDAALRRHLLPKIGVMRATDVTRRDIKNVFARLTKLGKNVMANKVLAHASGMFAWAVEEELIPANPCLGLKRNKVTPRDRHLDYAEIPKFWVACAAAVSERDCAALRLMLATGQRPGEVCGMRWEHVDLGPRRLWSIPDTKRNRPHTVALSGLAVEVLLSVCDGVRPGEGGVFGERPLRLPNPKRVYEAAGIKPFKNHSLRHTVVTSMSREGVLGEVVSRVVNHAAPGSTITNDYNHYLYTKEKREALQIWADRVRALLANPPEVDDGNVLRPPEFAVST